MPGERYLNMMVHQKGHPGTNRRSIGLGIDDHNIVTLEFDIEEMTKAKASILFDEKEKLMISTRVEGISAIRFYSTA